MDSLPLKEHYGTLSQTITALNELGYTLDFNIQNECIVCHKENIRLSPEEFKIDKFYRFEGISDPEDQSIIYAISSPKFNVKGVLISAYGPDSDEYALNLISKLNAHGNDPAQKPASSPADANTGKSSLSKFDLQKMISTTINEGAWKEKDIVSSVVFKSDHLRIVLMGFHKNAELKEHTAKGPITLQVLSGAIVFTANGDQAKLEKNQMITLDGAVPHNLVASEESFVLLTLVNLK